MGEQCLFFTFLQSGEFHLRKSPFIRKPHSLLGTDLEQGGGAFLSGIPLMCLFSLVLCLFYNLNIEQSNSACWSSGGDNSQTHRDQSCILASTSEPCASSSSSKCHRSWSTVGYLVAICYRSALKRNSKKYWSFPWFA